MAKIGLTWVDNILPYLRALNLNKLTGAAEDANNFYKTSGTNAYSVTTPNGNYVATDACILNVWVQSTNTGAVTFNIDSGGAITAVDGDGDAFVGGELESGKFYTFVYNNSTGNFTLAPKGGGGGLDFLGTFDYHTTRALSAYTTRKSVSGQGWLLTIGSSSVNNQLNFIIDGGTRRDVVCLENEMKPEIARYETGFTVASNSAAWFCSWLEDDGSGKIENAILKFDGNSKSATTNLRKAITGEGTLSYVGGDNSKPFIRVNVDGNDTDVNGVVMPSALCIKKFVTSVNVYSSSSEIEVAWNEQ